MNLKFVYRAIAIVVSLVLLGCADRDDSGAIETSNNQRPVIVQEQTVTELQSDRLPQNGTDFVSTEWNVRISDVAPVLYITPRPSRWNSNVVHFEVFLVADDQQIADIQFEAYSDNFALSLKDRANSEVDSLPAVTQLVDKDNLGADFSKALPGFDTDDWYWFFFESPEAGTIVRALIHETHTALITEQFEFIRS